MVFAGDEWAGELIAPESEIELSDSESEVKYLEPDSTPLQTETTAQQLLCLRCSVRRDLWRAVTQSCSGDCVGVVMS